MEMSLTHLKDKDMHAGREGPEAGIQSFAFKFNVPSWLNSLVLSRGQFASQGTFGHVWRRFSLSQVEEVLLAWSGQRSGVMLHILQYTGQQQGIFQPQCRQC